MRIYDKRIAFVISSQHLIPHGGVGQFAKGFLELAEQFNWVVDLIIDKKPKDYDFLDVKGKVVYPESVSYSDHNKAHAFSESFNLEMMTNFRNSMLLAFQSNLYDMVVVNTPEGLPAVYNLNISKKIPIVFYSHNQTIFMTRPNAESIFTDAFTYFYKSLLNLPNLIIATQTEGNLKEMREAGYKNSVCLPMPIPEKELLEPSDHYDKTGVLFIGRWEKGKQPKEFIRIIRETNLPAKVMTSKSSAPKFEKALKEIGVEYDVRAGITGKEKVEFIKGSRLFFMPSKLETYGFAMIECIGHMPCVGIEGYEWQDNFKDSKLVVASKKAVHSTILDLYNNPPKGDLDFLLESNKSANRWKVFLDKISSRYYSKASNNSVISKKNDLYYSEHVSDLNRVVSSEDIISVLNAKDLFSIKYTDSETWLSKTNTVPKEIEKDEGIFSCLT